MTVTINGSTGIDKVQDGSIVQADLASGVAGNGPAFSAYASAAQTISTGTWTKCVFGSVVYDTNSNYSVANNRFTPTVAGYYLITGSFGSGTGNAGEIVVSIYKNGSNYLIGTDITPTGSWNVPFSALVYCNGSTDYVEIYTYMGTGVTTSASSARQYFQAFLARSA